MDDKAVMEQQYGNSANLSARIRLHQRYSTNPEDFYTWLLAQYRFPTGAVILELGCGTGRQWETGLSRLPPDATLVLSDFSRHMAETVGKKFAGAPNVTARQIDICSIPYPHGIFDAVIANHMLYHVPDIPGGLSEVRRVLKPGGIFYAATNGSDMQDCLRKHLRTFSPGLDPFPDEISFSLENGRAQLTPYFDDVTLLLHEDSLHVTETADLIDWLVSAAGLGGYSTAQLDGIFDYFEAVRQKSGGIDIPKRAGLFRAVKRG